MQISFRIYKCADPDLMFLRFYYGRNFASFAKKAIVERLRGSQSRIEFPSSGRLIPITKGADVRKVTLSFDDKKEKDIVHIFDSIQKKGIFLKSVLRSCYQEFPYRLYMQGNMPLDKELCKQKADLGESKVTVKHNSEAAAHEPAIPQNPKMVSHGSKTDDESAQNTEESRPAQMGNWHDGDKKGNMDEGSYNEDIPDGSDDAMDILTRMMESM